MAFDPLDPFDGIDETDMDAMSDALEKQANEARLLMQDLRKDGVEVPPYVVLGMRLDALIELVLGEATPDRAIYEANVGSQIIAELMDAKKQIAKQKLHVVRPTNGLIR